jgi:hypothetical protein
MLCTKFWMKPERFTPVNFYPYTSIVTNIIWEQSHNRITDDHKTIEEFAGKIKSMAEAMGARWDNKVVVEIAYTDLMNNPRYIQSNLFIGYKDGRIVIGLGVWMADSWIIPQSL